MLLTKDRNRNVSTSDTMGVLQNTDEKEVLFLQQHFTADKQLVNPRAKQCHRQVGGCILINMEPPKIKNKTNIFKHTGGGGLGPTLKYR